ncbi:MAG: hypothetical protein OEU25_20265 [Rhodospirillales bacterium]|nr:hypothetical protein [Rhodospirillales bacterium]
MMRRLCIAGLVFIFGIGFASGTSTGVQTPFPQFLDLSIARIALLEPASTTRRLGAAPHLDHEALGFSYYRYRNATGSQAITLIGHPGDIRFSIAEVQISRRRADDVLPAFPNGVRDFVSGKGIKLGLSRAQVLEILGPPTAEIRSSIECRAEGHAAILSNFSMPSYVGTYHFEQGLLTEFRFGFPYP